MQSWTANQLVAYNLAKARQMKGWTQEQAARAVAPYQDGVEWSKVTWSAAERSVDGKRIRQFSADDLLAFSRAFDLPLTWWLLPPGSDEDVTIAGLELVHGDSRSQIGQEWMVFLLLNRPPEVTERLERTGLVRVVKEIAAAQPSVEELEAMAASLYRAWDLIRGAINVVSEGGGDLIRGAINVVSEGGGDVDDVDFSAHLDELYRSMAEASSEDKQASPKRRRATQ